MPRPEQTPEDANIPRVVILGSDAILAARPATPVQLAHAALQAGYSLAVPGAWGDELVAAECVRQLGDSKTGTKVMCSCPMVRQRLVARGTDLVPFMISLVSPPVAAAKYVRAAARREIRIHFVGRCPSGTDSAIDRWIDPNDFLRLLTERGIELSRQPIAFEGVIPPDRRRHWSLAGGFPAPEHLWESGGRRRRVEPEPDIDLAAAVVQQLLSPEPGLLDLAPGLHCSCAGVVADAPPRSARATLALTEPPRASQPVLDHTIALELSHPILAAAPVPEIVDVPPPFRPSGPYARTSGSFRASDIARPSGHGERRSSPNVQAPESSLTRRRPSPAGTIRPSPTSVPVSRQSDGRLVPRAYAARRRLTPPGVPTQVETQVERTTDPHESAAADDASEADKVENAALAESRG